MKGVSASRLAVIAVPLVLGGCVTAAEVAQYSADDAGFATVAMKSLEASGKQTVWVQSREEATAIAQQVHERVYGQTISADTAVQVALINNKGLQAAYAEVGISAAEVWQQALPQNPTVSVGALGIAAPALGAFRA
ncbi:MAG: TolC family protein, partial [Paracoccaceae bacterium]